MDRVESIALLERAKAGSADALNDLFERWAARLLALIRLRMGRGMRAHVESRDILNASLLKAFQHLDQFRRSDTRSLMAWLARIVENEIRDQADYHKRQRRDAGLVVSGQGNLDGLVAEVRSQSSRMVLDERLEQMTTALENLDPAHREVIVLRKLEELSFQEIARRLDRSPDACRMLLARALTALTLAMHDTP